MKKDIVIALFLVSLLVLLICYLASLPKRFNLIPTTKEGAIKALEHIQEWAKWMSGIQTAAIAGLAVLVFDKGKPIMPLTFMATLFILSAFVCLGAAIYCSAWILSSLASQIIRVYAQLEEGKLDVFDVYGQPLFDRWKQVTLGYLLSLNHWLWGAGLLSFGLFIACKLV